MQWIVGLFVLWFIFWLISGSCNTSGGGGSDNGYDDEDSTQDDWNCSFYHDNNSSFCGFGMDDDE